MAGLLAGILLSRMASGALAGAIGWRATFAAAAGLMVLLAAVMRVALPRQTPAQPLAWRAIIASLGGIVRREPLLRRHALVGACGFATFSAFWSTLSFHLAQLGYGARTAGFFGVIGLTGVAVAPIVGRLTGRVRARHPERGGAAGRHRRIRAVLGRAAVADSCWRWGSSRWMPASRGATSRTSTWSSAWTRPRATASTPSTW